MSLLRSLSVNLKGPKNAVYMKRTQMHQSKLLSLSLPLCVNDTYKMYLPWMRHFEVHFLEFHRHF